MASSTGPDGEGVRVRIAVSDPPACAVAEALPPGGEARDVTRASRDGEVVERFRASAADAERLFDGGDDAVYCRTLPADDACPCRRIESLGYPVSDVRVETHPTRITATLVLSSTDALAEVVDRVERAGATVSLRRITRGDTGDRRDTVTVDRRRLTDRQREVLRTAHRLGYFEYPREASATDVADELGIARSTFAEHLAAAQGALFEDVFDG